MKTLITFRFDHANGLTTNSSSELFCFKGESKEIVEQMIRKTHPNYRREYCELKGRDDLDFAELDYVFTYVLSDDYTGIPNYITHKTVKEVKEYFVKWGLDFDTFYEPFNFEDYLLSLPEEDRTNKWVLYKKQYAYILRECTEELVQKMRNAIPENQYFLFSIEDNPYLEYQEKLEIIGKRYHLG